MNFQHGMEFNFFTLDSLMMRQCKQDTRKWNPMQGVDELIYDYLAWSRLVIKCAIKKSWKSFHFLANVSDDDVYRIDSECIVDKVIVVCLRQEEDGHLQFVNVLKRDDDDQKNFFYFILFYMGSAESFFVQCMNTCQDMLDDLEEVSMNWRRTKHAFDTQWSMKDNSRC